MISFIDSINWEAISAAGTWFGAAATFSAVVVSLYHASLAFKPRIRCTVALSRNAVANKYVSQDYKGVVFTITNIGSVDWIWKSILIERAGLYAHETYAQSILEVVDSDNPFRCIAPGESIKWTLGTESICKVPKRITLKRLVREYTGRPYRMSLVDASGKRERVDVPRWLQEYLSICEYEMSEAMNKPRIER